MAAEVEIAETSKGWRLWLLNRAGERASVEPVETFDNVAALEAWSRGYETARLRMTGRPRATQRAR